MNILETINKFDNNAIHLFKKYTKNKYFDILMPAITSMGNLGAIWIIAAVIIYIDNKQIFTAYIVVFTLIISTIIGEGIIKNIVRRVRPCNQHNNIYLLISRPLSYSFPSGHTLSSFAVSEILSTYFPHYRFIFMIMASLIALSRIYLLVHYPTDIIGGVILGILCAKLILILLQTEFIQLIGNILFKVLL